MQALTRINLFADGSTRPKVHSGVAILLVQDGSVQVGRLLLDGEYAFMPGIEHPQNASDLNPVARQVIQKRKPEYLSAEVAVLALCPKELAVRCVWT